ncbi:hypothetical protein CCMA1212_001622 [Trichoderma ghanense]|uniref:Uncharacterized protein n=1 Tax=Trichoderma ghanense TaxID=65468 RepID=A0ABY2HGQ3_9HYPO
MVNYNYPEPSLVGRREECCKSKASHVLVARTEIGFFPKHPRAEQRMELDCRPGSREMNRPLLDKAAISCPQAMSLVDNLAPSRVTVSPEPRLQRFSGQLQVRQRRPRTRVDAVDSAAAGEGMQHVMYNYIGCALESEEVGAGTWRYEIASVAMQFSRVAERPRKYCQVLVPRPPWHPPAPTSPEKDRPARHVRPAMALSKPLLGRWASESMRWLITGTPSIINSSKSFPFPFSLNEAGNPPFCPNPRLIVLHPPLPSSSRSALGERLMHGARPSSLSSWVGPPGHAAGSAARAVNRAETPDRLLSDRVGASGTWEWPRLCRLKRCVSVAGAGAFATLHLFVRVETPPKGFRSGGAEQASLGPRLQSQPCGTLFLPRRLLACAGIYLLAG